MNNAVSQWNLVFAWVWMLAGFVSGMIMGLKFQDENWLGGYASFRRRMYRLGHISFFGLGAVNLFFYLSVKDAALSAFGGYASMAFIVGGVSMPLCCWLMAASKRFQASFAVPVLSLIAGAILTILEVVPNYPSAGDDARSALPGPTESVERTKTSHVVSSSFSH